MVFDDCPQSVQIKDSPGIEDFNIKIEVSGLIFIVLVEKAGSMLFLYIES